MNLPRQKTRHGAMTRRLFLGATGLAAALTLVPDVLPAASGHARIPAAEPVERAPVLAVYMNRLYLDVTGRDTPYQAPTASRDEEWLLDEGDQEYFRHFLY